MPLRPDDVFIPGGLPEETYVSREHLKLEDDLTDWLTGRQKPLLSVSGPTKSGKTVLIRKVIDNPIRLSGGALDSARDFWNAICDELEVFTEHTLEVNAGESDALGISGGVSAGFIEGSVSGSNERFTDRSITRSRAADPRSAARRALSNTDRIVFIDDFHYIDPREQTLIVRGLKDLIFDGLGVVVASVPHRAYDVVRVEKEMTGRVQQLDVAQWSLDDLRLIGAQGFGALNVDVSDAIVDRVSSESFGSPHLMQTHCLNLCKVNRDGKELQPAFEEPGWQEFFEQQASATSKSAFDLLKTGPRQRKDRLPRTLKSGITTDIYGAVLAAIAHTGPQTSLVYEEIRAALREVLSSDLPQRHEVTNVLEQMTDIAKSKIEGEPVLEYDAEYSTLHLVDPYFAYYLRWAPPALKNIEVTTPSL